MIFHVQVRLFFLYRQLFQLISDLKVIQRYQEIPLLHILTIRYRHLGHDSLCRKRYFDLPERRHSSLTDDLIVENPLVQDRRIHLSQTILKGLCHSRIRPAVTRGGGSLFSAPAQDQQTSQPAQSKRPSQKPITNIIFHDKSKVHFVQNHKGPKSGSDSRFSPHLPASDGIPKSHCPDCSGSAADSPNRYSRANIDLGPIHRSIRRNEVRSY